MRWLFPWFFPLTEMEAEPDMQKEQGVYNEEARKYHFNSRHAANDEEALYPQQGGFGYWIESMLEQMQGNVESMLGAEDIEFDFDLNTLRLNSIKTNNKIITADKIFWCAPLPILCRILGWTLPEGLPQIEILGNFAFRKLVNMDFHEILFADPEHLIRRVNSPSLIAGNGENKTLQVEFTTPINMYNYSDEEWTEKWLNSLKKLNLVSKGNEVLNCEIRQVSRGIVTTADLNQFVDDCREKLSQSESNLITPHLAAASDNNSRLIPNVYNTIIESISK